MLWGSMGGFDNCALSDEAMSNRNGSFLTFERTMKPKAP
jgi:hypothetical protein